jgi:hypothetical protein
MRNRNIFMTMLLVLACFGLLPVAQAGNNTGFGDGTLSHITTGQNNSAFGWAALFSNNTGERNTAVGAGALVLNTSGVDNTAVGTAALLNNTGGANTAVGRGALDQNVSGNFNTAIGKDAGGLATGSGNVYIGHLVAGVAGENNHTYIRNIKDTTVSGGGADFVTVDTTTGLLGRVGSSRRYKEEIAPMNNASETLYRLKPVTFRYKKEIDRNQVLEYGLVAEDVAEVNPNLAIRDGKGQIDSVRYTAVNAMLLNEFLKEHKKVQDLEVTVAQQQRGMEVLTAQLKEQAAQIQKVNAQLEVSKPATKVVLNNR